MSRTPRKPVIYWALYVSTASDFMVARFSEIIAVTSLSTLPSGTRMAHGHLVNDDGTRTSVHRVADSLHFYTSLAALEECLALAISADADHAERVSKQIAILSYARRLRELELGRCLGLREIILTETSYA